MVCGSRPLGVRARATVRATIALWVALLGFAVRAAETAPAGVLILHSNQRPTPAQVVIDDQLRTVVTDGFKRPVQIFSEYLDDEWVSLQTYGAVEAGFLQQKYGGRNIRVAVTDSLPALRFAMQFRERVLAGVPVVFLAVARDRVDRASIPPDIVGVFEDHDPTPTLRLAQRLHPGTTRLVVIRGASELDRLWDHRLRAAVGRLGNGLEVEYLAGLPTADVLRRVGALSRGTVVFTPGYFVDGDAQVSTPRQTVERISQASTVPVYGAFDTLLGAGIVGGYMTRYEDQAREAGALVVRLLNGVTPAEIESSPVARVPMVDWRQLRRWRVDEGLLPAGTIVRSRDPTIWNQYWREISVAAVVLVLQAGLIAALLVERRSRRRTATALEGNQAQMSLAARAVGLSSWIWDTARDVARTTPLARVAPDPSPLQPIAFDRVVAAAHPADRDSLKRAVSMAQRTGEELDVEYRVVAPGGAVRWISARGRAEEREPNRLLGIALDITERKLAELRASEDRAALRQMGRVSMAGQLSAAIAHQLNQPLAAILGNAEAAQKILGHQDIDVKELRAICSDIVSENHRATEIMRRLRELYMHGDIKIEPIDLNQLILETLELLRTELLLRHVTPVTDLATVPAIEGGHVQLQQVLLNLVLNAADAMDGKKPAERTLTIRTESAATDVRLHVEDNGTGIAGEHLKNIFNPFWSTKAEGMGMGLAICQSIVASHHGTITAANNAHGGAAFCVTLPTAWRESSLT